MNASATVVLYEMRPTKPCFNSFLFFGLDIAASLNQEISYRHLAQESESHQGSGPQSMTSDHVCVCVCVCVCVGGGGGGWVYYLDLGYLHSYKSNTVKVAVKTRLNRISQSQPVSSSWSRDQTM